MSMFLNSFEFTSEDIVNILRAHDTDITIHQIAEIHDVLDHDSIVRSALQYDDPDMQLKSALSKEEDLMIMDGLFITEPKRFHVDD
jgi:predicted Zn-ribbon and HTH transcriptional regulator